MKHLLFCLSLALLLGSCSDDDNDRQPRRLTAPSVVMGNGTAHAWLDRDAQGNPTALGFTMSKGALDQLPATLPATMYMLAIPDEARATTPFQHIMLDWNPQGHEPPGTYDVPHFDFHFYIMPMNEVMQIPPYPMNPAAFDKNPAPVYLPASYIKVPGGVPAMGAHWLDPTSPEFGGQPFTETFVYGTYNGRVTFIEPMVALSYLRTSPSLDKEIKQPAQYEQPGYFPERYTIKTNADGSIDVALTQLVLR